MKTPGASVAVPIFTLSLMRPSDCGRIRFLDGAQKGTSSSAWHRLRLVWIIDQPIAWKLSCLCCVYWGSTPGHFFPFFSDFFIVILSFFLLSTLWYSFMLYSGLDGERLLIGELRAGWNGIQSITLEENGGKKGRDGSNPAGGILSNDYHR